MCSRNNSQILPPTDSIGPATVPLTNGDAKQNILESSSNSGCADVDSLNNQNSDVKTEIKKTSPSKANNTAAAVEPSESAHMVNLVNG